MPSRKFRPRRGHALARTLGACACAFGASVGCDTTAPNSATCTKPDLVFALSDSRSAGYAHLTFGAPPRAVFGIELGRDPVLAGTRNDLFFLSRLEDRAFPVSETCGELGAPLRTAISAERLGNPQDLAVGSDGTYWLSLFDTPVVLHLSSEGTPLGTTDLSQFDDDANPNASGIAALSTQGGERVFVALERLDNAPAKQEDYLHSTRPSSIVRLDPSTGLVTDEKTLAGRNPFGPFLEFGGALYVASLGSVRLADETDAGIVRVDPETLDSTLLVSERTLGGSVGAIAMGNVATGETPVAMCGAAIVLGPAPANPTTLVLFDPIQGEVRTSAQISPLATDGFHLTSLAFSGSFLFVGDKRKTDRGYPVQKLRVGRDCTATLEPPLTYFALPAVGTRATP